jgi:hypothetical protein
MIRRPIASEIRRPVDASSSKKGRHLSGISAQESGELLAGEEASLVELVGAPAATPRQQDHGLRPVAKQASVAA